MVAFSFRHLLGSIDGLFSPKAPVLQENSKRNIRLSPEKQKKLENLYRQLLTNKELIASGKIQFIGLEQIKKKMGKNWAGLSAFIYEITEEIIAIHTDKTDLFMGYKDDSYLIIFTNASLEEAKQKMTIITDEIRRRLFSLDDDQLRRLEIKHIIKQVKTKSFLEEQFPEITESGYSQSMLFKQKGKKLSALYSEKIEVSTEAYKAVSSPDIKIAPVTGNLHYMYVPLWEIKRAALTTYICLPSYAQSEKKSFFAYQELYKNKSKEQHLQLDLKTLEHVLAELVQMEKDGRKLYIGCPVCYETLYDFKIYEVYKNACEKISENHKEFLIFMIINSEETLPIKDPYWFIKPLKDFCYDVFIEVPIKHDTNFQLLKTSGAETIGIHLSHSSLSEQENMNISNSFSSKAKYFKIQKTFALGVSTLSATTSLVCAGFDYIGGTAIHEDVTKPDTIHRYRYEDLLADMIKTTPQK